MAGDKEEILAGGCFFYRIFDKGRDVFRGKHLIICTGELGIFRKRQMAVGAFRGKDGGGYLVAINSSWLATDLEVHCFLFCGYSLFAGIFILRNDADIAVFPVKGLGHILDGVFVTDIQVTAANPIIQDGVVCFGGRGGSGGGVCFSGVVFPVPVFRRGFVAGRYQDRQQGGHGKDAYKFSHRVLFLMIVLFMHKYTIFSFALCVFLLYGPKKWTGLKRPVRFFVLTISE